MTDVTRCGTRVPQSIFPGYDRYGQVWHLGPPEFCSAMTNMTRF